MQWTISITVKLIATKNKPVIPSTKTPVSDNSHLTDDEKGQVKDNVQKNNPAGKVINVDDHGNTTITLPRLLKECSIR